MDNQSQKNTIPNRTVTYPPGYGIVEPVANYRPWDIDEQFQEVYAQVQGHTMVDVYRLWILWTLVRRAVDGNVLEVGSWRGGSGAVMARAATFTLPGQPERRVFLADTFSGVVKAGSKDTYYKGGEHRNTSPEMVRDLLNRLGLDQVELLVGVFPGDSADAIEDLRLSFCHIDVDVYQSARDSFEWVWPRVASGGVVVFDDYGFYGCEGVTICVEEIMSEYPLAVVVPNLTGQAVVVKG